MPRSTHSLQHDGSAILCAYCERDFQRGRSLKQAQRVRDAHERDAHEQLAPGISAIPSFDAEVN